MSLLMDALKKAEQEKKEAAKRLKDAESQSGEKLELAENGKAASIKYENQSPLETVQDQSESSLAQEVQPLSLETLEYEDKEKNNLSLEIKPSDSQTGENVINDITIEHPELSVPELSLSEQVQETKTQEIPVVPRSDPTYATSQLEIEKSSESEMAIDDTVQTPEPEEFYDTLSESRTITSVVSAAELASDIGGGKHQPTPVAAQTVFTAVAKGGEKEGYKWAIFLILCTVVVASLSVIYYFEIIPSSTGTSSPMVAKGIDIDPSSLPSIDVPEEVVQGAIRSESDIEKSIQDRANSTMVDEPEVTMAEPQSSMEQTIAEPVAITSANESVQAEAPDKEMAQAKSRPVTIPETEIESQTLPETIEVEPAAIKITRSKSVDGNKKLINAAYEQYKSGNYNAAKTGYLEILKTVPENRDALLGLGAIAFVSGDIQNAYNYYHKVLKLYPQDNIARSALINLQNGKNSDKSESALKIMINREPEVAFLHYVLGNIYASQSRWSDAQQAFFDAYRYESSNPDYAFNLAVSLDRIGQTKTALDYYNVALQLADSGNVNFNTAVLLERIKTISAANQLTN